MPGLRPLAGERRYRGLSTYLPHLSYLFCERLYKGASKVWCPSPEGYPKHCCYDHGLAELRGSKKTVDPARYLLDVYPL